MERTRWFWTLVAAVLAFDSGFCNVSAFISQTQNYRLGTRASSSTLVVPQRGGQIIFRQSVILNLISSSSSSSSFGVGNKANEYSFFDEAFIYVRGGSGGQGASTYKRKVGGTGQNGPPDGGNGGRGGNVVLRLDPSLNTLAGLNHAWRPNSFGGSRSPVSKHPKSFRAENGGDGGPQCRDGRCGMDKIIHVPPGTVVQEVIIGNDQDLDTSADGVNGDRRVVDLGTLTISNREIMVVARGGIGGEGSGVQTPKAQSLRRTRIASTGGERKLLKLTLQIVADVALVGVPNAGKSTFLASVTRAKPKIDNYPFTTVIPNLGVWMPTPLDLESSGATDDSEGAQALVLCDVPGLIEGASQGVGLGHAFLRHVERCRVILHLLDATSENPIADYTMLNQELVKYGTGQLAKMPQVVVVNKADVFEEWTTVQSEEEEGKIKFERSELEAKLRAVMPHSRLMWISARERDGIDELMTRLAAFVKKVKETASS